jgi:hypothetical protein
MMAKVQLVLGNFPLRDDWLVAWGHGFTLAARTLTIQEKGM